MKCIQCHRDYTVSVVYNCYPGLYNDLIGKSIDGHHCSDTIGAVAYSFSSCVLNVFPSLFPLLIISFPYQLLLFYCCSRFFSSFTHFCIGNQNVLCLNWWLCFCEFRMLSHQCGYLYYLIIYVHLRDLMSTQSWNYVFLKYKLYILVNEMNTSYLGTSWKMQYEEEIKTKIWEIFSKTHWLKKKKKQEGKQRKVYIW